MINDDISDTVKTVTAYLMASVGISLVTHGTQNNIKVQVFSGVIPLIFLSISGIAISLYSLLSEGVKDNTNEDENSLAEINRSQYDRFFAVLAFGIIAFAVLLFFTR